MKGTTLWLAVLLWSAAGVVPAGAQLERPERQAMDDTLQYALEYNRSNQAADWVNPDTEHSGSAVPLRTFENRQGQPCREFVSTIVIGGREEQGYGTACRQPDGSWEIVDDRRPPPPRVTVPPPAPPAYYYYPRRFYSPYNIFLSFDLVYRDGHFYRGKYYKSGRDFRRHDHRHLHLHNYFAPRLHDGYHRHGLDKFRKHRRGDDSFRRDHRDDDRFRKERRGGSGRR